MRDGGRRKNTKQKESGKGPGLWPPKTSLPLSFSQPFFFSPASLPYLPKPSNYSNEWLRVRQRRRQREAVRDWKDRWGRRREVRKKEIPLSIRYECHPPPDPALIGQWRLTAGTRCQDLECALLSYWLCESWCVVKWACGLKWKCHSKAAFIQSTFLW